MTPDSLFLNTLSLLCFYGTIFSLFFLCLSDSSSVRQGTYGGPVAEETSRSQCKWPGLNPWSGNYVPHAILGVPAGSAVKNLPVVQETWVQSLGQDNPPEKEMATHCSILAWRIPGIEEPGRLQSMGLQESDMT